MTHWNARNVNQRQNTNIQRNESSLIEILELLLVWILGSSRELKTYLKVTNMKRSDREWVPEWLKSSQILEHCSPKCIQAELLVVYIFKVRIAKSELRMEVCNLIFLGKHLWIDMQTVLLKSHIRSIDSRAMIVSPSQRSSSIVFGSLMHLLRYSINSYLPFWVTAICHHLPSNGMQFLNTHRYRWSLFIHLSPIDRSIVMTIKWFLLSPPTPCLFTCDKY